MSLNIENRRYIGNKRKLVKYIFLIVKEYFKDEKIIFADLFAGTGVVANYFYEHNYSVIVNDNLYSNFIAYKTWISNDYIDLSKIEKVIFNFNNIDKTKIIDNYFSKIYGNKYFSVNNAKKIGYIRDQIENMKEDLKPREYFALLASLMYATDKVANTVGHFEHYLSHSPKDKDLILEVPTTHTFNNNLISIYNMDTNLLAPFIEADVVYIDPPYNGRQYINFYHVLENLARWEKPTQFEGKSMKFKRNHLKSEYSRSRAVEYFTELIQNIKAKLILVSYNNTYNARSSASNNKIKEEEIIEILSKKGKVSIKEYDYPYFNSGKTNFSNHLEKIYICEVINNE